MLYRCGECWDFLDAISPIFMNTCYKGVEASYFFFLEQKNPLQFDSAGGNGEGPITSQRFYLVTINNGWPWPHRNLLSGDIPVSFHLLLHGHPSIQPVANNHGKLAGLSACGNLSRRRTDALGCVREMEFGLYQE